MMFVHVSAVTGGLWCGRRGALRVLKSLAAIRNCGLPMSGEDVPGVSWEAQARKSVRVIQIKNGVRFGRQRAHPGSQSVLWRSLF